METWRNTLDSIGFRLIRTKTKYIFSWGASLVKIEIGIERQSKFDGQEIPKNDYFKFLESMIHKDGEIEDVAHITRTGWVKWRSASGVPLIIEYLSS
jgi:hypothetical protein